MRVAAIGAARAAEHEKIAMLLPSLAAGGVARASLHLAQAFIAAGRSVDLLLCRAEGPYLNAVPAGVRIVPLQRESRLATHARMLKLDPGGLGALARPALLARRPAWVERYLADLARYLRQVRPGILLAAKTPANLLALWARELSDTDTSVVVAEHTQLSQSVARSGKWRWRYIAPLVARVYRDADGIVCVSNGVADDLARTTGLARSRMSTIYNPVVTPATTLRASEAPAHPWLLESGRVPLILGAGRLVAQKNFPLLLRAFARLRARRAARVLILGEGRERPQLEALASELGIAADVALPGHVQNPYAAFSRASLFVLSSDWEGLPTVLIEALACGCPVVSTDCPSGPAEILEGGRYGRLVPTGDVDAMTDAIERTLEAPPPAGVLGQRAAAFSVERSARSYLALLDDVRARASLR